ncbi:MAG: hypothetical protein IJ900_00085 [Paludibacteraceae bacterium]|nr:hypothetical protein [Paludibacteraceae bacterium]
MRKLKLFSLLAVLLCSATMWAGVAVNGKLPGAFSVSADKQVNFSQGNLQYNSNTQAWQFAENQYTYVVTMMELVIRTLQKMASLITAVLWICSAG